MSFEITFPVGERLGGGTTVVMRTLLSPDGEHEIDINAGYRGKREVASMRHRALGIEIFMVEHDAYNRKWKDITVWSRAVEEYFTLLGLALAQDKSGAIAHQLHQAIRMAKQEAFQEGQIEARRAMRNALGIC